MKVHRQRLDAHTNSDGWNSSSRSQSCAFHVLKYWSGNCLSACLEFSLLLFNMVKTWLISFQTALLIQPAQTVFNMSNPVMLSN